MADEPTTFVIQRYLDALASSLAQPAPQPSEPAARAAAHSPETRSAAEETPADPIIRELLEKAVGRLRLLCASLLYRSYPRLTRPPLNLETDELLSGIVARLLTALRETRPTSVRQFFALANQHLRWQLNDLARRLNRRNDGIVFGFHDV